MLESTISIFQPHISTMAGSADSHQDEKALHKKYTLLACLCHLSILAKFIGMQQEEVISARAQ
jgi:hypothetical protein